MSSGNMLGRFRVQPRVVQILGDHYRTSESAITELVANAWDADASRVDIALPLAISGQPIVIRDDGCGMTAQELRAQYLEVGFDRRAAMGSVTKRGRRVRGQLGIGKFAGFVLANRMLISTVARGRRCGLMLDRKGMLGSNQDLEGLQLPIDSEPTDAPSGTRIELSILKPGHEQPSPKKVGMALLAEFGLRDDFAIYIDDARLSYDLMELQKVQLDLDLPGPTQDEATRVSVAAWLSDRALGREASGMVLRVNDQTVGAPSYFGLEDDPEIPRSLLRRVYGEIRADHLAEYLTGSGNSIVASAAQQDVEEAARSWLRSQIRALADAQEGETEEEFVQSYEQQLELLPASRRELARQALLRVFKKLFGETPEKKHVVADLVINVFEEDRYWLIARKLDEIGPGDLIRLADVLRDWGLGDVAEVATRARHRLRFLAAFEQLVVDPTTLELGGVHRVLEAHAWLLGDQYELWASNRTMRRIVQQYCDEVYSGSNGRKRPDLVLVGLQQRFLLVELKRPSHEIGRQDMAQAEEYRDGLQAHLRDAVFQILVVGGSIERNLPRDDRREVRVSTYDELLIEARNRLDWLLKNIDAAEDQAPAQPRMPF